MHALKPTFPSFGDYMFCAFSGFAKHTAPLERIVNNNKSTVERREKRTTNIKNGNQPPLKKQSYLCVFVLNVF